MLNSLQVLSAKELIFFLQRLAYKPSLLCYDIFCIKWLSSILPSQNENWTIEIIYVYCNNIYYRT